MHCISMQALSLGVRSMWLHELVVVIPVIVFIGNDFCLVCCPS
jgi:hypothetical protein